MAAATATASASNPLSAEQVFDDIGPAYEQAFANLPTQTASLDWLLAQLEGHKPAKCLDIGCGTGKPVCSTLADAQHDVLGIDISGAMIDDARLKVPNAAFEKLDMADFQADAGTYDAITVYFSMIASVTQDEIRRNIERIHAWLKPGGSFVFATVPVAGNNLEIKWMGRAVTVSSLAAEEAVDWVRKVGFEIEYHGVSTFTPHSVEAGICKADDVWEEPHLFVYAKKR